MAQCQAVTKKGKGPTCINGDARPDGESGLWLCHLHHPQSLFRQQVSARKADRQQKSKSVRRLKPVLPPNKLRSLDLNLRADPPDMRTPGLDAPFHLSPECGKGFFQKPSPRVKRP